MYLPSGEKKIFVTLFQSTDFSTRRVPSRTPRRPI
jgi:hypothetical protein